ncbi:hypothetical protein IFM89_008948 [Coptis chinensis]|uniref:DUF4218 domain-containing protein n=1 Tax=Coptis chinensis TaxID=261450 RepID=A0A835IBZ4_9MAGN|nr:hypothetical protein IFM89_008948 [Coptis chinensis]
MMRTFKTYVKNKRYPEGCIVERYLVEESILYCNEYMPEGGNGSHSHGRKKFMDEEKGCSTIVEKKLVLFDEDGRPVGDKSADFSSSLGESSRAHAPIVFQRWKDIPNQKKDLIWELISPLNLDYSKSSHLKLQYFSKNFRKF